MTATAEETVKEQAQKMKELIKNSVIEMEKKQKTTTNHDFSWDVELDQKQQSVMAKHSKRRLKSYTSSRIKTRNFLSNISYTGVRNEDLVHNNFTFDMITLLTKNINPFSLEHKIADVKNKEIIYMLRDKCIERTYM